MTRKHYQMIANNIHYLIEQGMDTPTLHALAKALAYEFSQDNPLFNQVIFLKTCGVNA